MPVKEVRQRRPADSEALGGLFNGHSGGNDAVPDESTRMGVGGGERFHKSAILD